MDIDLDSIITGGSGPDASLAALVARFDEPKEARIQLLCLVRVAHDQETRASGLSIPLHISAMPARA